MIARDQRQHDKAAKFVALHRAPGAFVIPNPWDAGSARILAALGFEALATTSAGLAFALGRRDAEGLLSRGDALANAALIVQATDLPVSADLEDGFGPRPEDVAETVRQAAAIGLVGCTIEDTTADPAHPIHDFSLAVERIIAAVEAAKALPFPFTLTARAENFLFGRPDLEDTIRRLRAFEDAGANVLYAPGLPDLDAIRRGLCSRVAAGQRHRRTCRPPPFGGGVGRCGRQADQPRLDACPRGARRAGAGCARDPQSRHVRFYRRRDAFCRSECPDEAARRVGEGLRPVVRRIRHFASVSGPPRVGASALLFASATRFRRRVATYRAPTSGIGGKRPSAKSRKDRARRGIDHFGALRYRVTLYCRDRLNLTWGPAFTSRTVTPLPTR